MGSLDASAAETLPTGKPERSWLDRLVRNDWFGLFAFLAVAGAPVWSILVGAPLMLLALVVGDGLRWWDVDARGPDAKGMIRGEFQTRRALAWPTSAHDFFYYRHDGTLPHGNRCWWSMRCRTKEECRNFLDSVAGEKRGEVSPWKPPRNGEVLEDIATLQPEFASLAWNLKSIRHGASYEDFGDYYAIDFDTLRIYGSSR